MVKLKSPKDIEELKKSGKILSSILKEIRKEAKAGVQLKFFDELARELLKKFGAKPAFLGYKPEGAVRPFPAAICASVNEKIVHGIPSNYILKNGDILKLDFGVNFNGYITDAAITLGIGKISTEAKKLINVTKLALENAVKECKSNNYLGDIGFAIENSIKGTGFEIVKGLTGHGVGFRLHEDPSVYNYGKRGEGMKLAPGLVLAIEPMVNVGSGEIIQMSDDSFNTKDKRLSAHFEKTIAITENGREVITPF